MEEKKVAVSEKKEAAPKPLIIDGEVVEAHRRAHTFRSVAPGKAHDAPITGATARWQKKGGEAIIYDQRFRTVGTEDQVRGALKLAAANDDEIEDAIVTAFTIDTPSQEGEIRDQFLAEVEGAKMATYTPRDYGLEWEAMAPFFQAKKIDITQKSKVAKGKKRTDTKRAKPKKKTAADVQKELLEKQSDFVLVFNPKGFSRMKETSIGRTYYYNKENRVAFQTPEELAAAKAALNFGDFDVDRDFNEWYQKREAAGGAATSSAAAKKPAAPAPAPSGSQSPVKAKVPAKAAKAAPAAAPEPAAEAPKAAPAASAAKASAPAAKPAAAPRRRVVRQ